MQHNYGASYQDVKLRPLVKDDIEYLRQWRNDASKTQYLRNIGEITPQMQEKWFEEYLQDEDQLVFAIEETADLHRIVGSVALYNFNGKTAEVGKIQIGDNEANGRGIGRKSLVMVMWIAFKKLGLEKIVAAVHPDNVAAYKNDIKIGFRVVGKHPAPVGGGFEDEIEIDEMTLSAVNGYTQEIELA